MAKLITEDGMTREVIPSNGESFTLEEMQRFVGGLIEPVYLDDERIILVNEEGLLLNMPVNMRASMLVGFPLAGPALLVSGKEFN
jgi:hypothetical protein